MFENISERQQELQFRKILAKEENQKCADCKQKGASWASLGFGVLICITCSGIHRSFGMHITRVRSTKLDSWTKADIYIIDTVGNQIANLYWEHKVIFHGKEKMFFESSKAQYIKQKYIQKSYAKSNVPNPVDYIIENKYKVKPIVLKNLYKNEGKKNEKIQNKKEKKKNFDFIKSKKQTQQQNTNFDFLNMHDKSQSVNNKHTHEDFLGLDLLDDTIPYHKSKSQIEEQDFLSTNITKPDIKQNDLDLFDFTNDKKDTGNINIIVNSHVNNINIQNIKCYNQAPPQQQNQDDKYKAFDFFHVQNPHYHY